MEHQVKDTLRAAATAIGVSAGLLILASTAQTPDGFIHASFGGPLDVFSLSASGAADVLAIGDGNNDATELASLLKGPLGPAAKSGVVPNSPYRVAYEAGAAGVAPVPVPGAGVPSLPAVDDPATATAAPTRKDAAILPPKPVVDSQGRIDCSGALSCRTDPVTNVTTVTYPDGVVAVVQKINDLTVVAYKTLTQMLPSELSALLPEVRTPAPPPLLAAVVPAPVPVVDPPVVPSIAPTQVPAVTPKVPVVESEPSSKPSAPETAVAPINPGPAAPSVDLDPTDNGPKVNVTTPSPDFSPGGGGTGNGTGADDSGTDASTPSIPGLGKVKDAIDGVVGSVKGAVGSVLGPGASSKPDDTGSSGGDSASEDTKSDRSGNDG